MKKIELPAASDAPGDRTAASRPHLLLVIATLIMAVAYLLQLASPLRLHPDAVSYLQLASSFADGHGFVEFNGKPTHFPPGYPALLAALDRFHIANSLTFIAANLVFLAAGTIAAFFILRRSLGLSFNAALACCNLSLLSWVVVKHVAIPLSDFPYYGLSLLAVWMLSCLENTQGSKRMPLAIFSLVLIAAATLTRTIGIALLPAFLWASLSQRQEALVRVFTTTRRRRIVLAVLAVVAIILAVAAFSYTRYGQASFLRYRGEGSFHMAAATFTWRTLEFGSLGANLPYGPHFSLFSILPCLDPGSPTCRATIISSINHVCSLVGLLFIATIGCGIWLRKTPLSPLTIYVLAYLGIMFVWPYVDPRFWIPIFPLLVGYTWIVVCQGAAYGQIVRVMALLYLGCFVVLGLAALGNETRISLAGDRFINLYYVDECRDYYKIVYQHYKIAYSAAHEHQPLKNVHDDTADIARKECADDETVRRIFKRFELSCK